MKIKNCPLGVNSLHGGLGNKLVSAATSKLNTWGFTSGDARAKTTTTSTEISMKDNFRVDIIADESLYCINLLKHFFIK